MLFVVSKIVGFFAIPSNLIISIGVIGLLLLLTRYAHAGRRLAFASLILLVIVGLSPLGNALIIPLEERFPAWDPASGPPAGIVVLGGSLSPHVSAARNVVALNEAAERLTVAAELALRYPHARILFSGGSGALIFGEGSEAEFAVRVFESFGVPRGRVILEDRSRNTLENAILSKDLARPQPGALAAGDVRLSHGAGDQAFFARPVSTSNLSGRLAHGRKKDACPFPTVGDGLRTHRHAVREWWVFWRIGSWAASSAPVSLRLPPAGDERAAAFEPCAAGHLMADDGDRLDRVRTPLAHHRFATTETKLPQNITTHVAAGSVEAPNGDRDPSHGTRSRPTVATTSSSSFARHSRAQSREAGCPAPSTVRAVVEFWSIRRANIARIFAADKRFVFSVRPGSARRWRRRPRNAWA
jgi:uncharacterized SAM-binding protein YcdF (DUF218 family)